MSDRRQLEPFFKQLDGCSATRWEGHVTQVVGQLVESQGPLCCVGDLCHLMASRGRIYPGEVVGFRGTTVLSMTLERAEGVGFGDRIAAWGARPVIRVSEELLGRVIDGAGDPLDGRPSCAGRDLQPLDRAAPGRSTVS